MKEEEDEASSQASIDDVTDDEDGDAVDDEKSSEEREENETEVLETQQSMHNFIRSTQAKPQSQGGNVNEVKRVGNAEISGANHVAYQ